MKNIILKILLLILLPYVVYASDISSSKNNYYVLMKDNLSKKFLQTKEGELLVTELDELVIFNQEKIILWGCNFKQLKGNKENINNELKQNNFFKEYEHELKKYHITTNNFIKIYSNDSDSLSDTCNINGYMNIILLASNKLIVPYENQFIFFKRLSEQEEININNYYNNEKCLKTKQIDIDTTDICYYNNMTILDVYNAMNYNPSHIFRKKIKVGENSSVFYEDKNVEINYKWSGKNKLEITQYFQGGITTYTFIYQNGKTKLITVLSPD